MKLHSSICLTIVASALALTASKSSAQEPTINPTGVWKVTRPSTNTQARASAQTLRLKLSGGALTGTFTYNCSAIINGKAKICLAPITKAELKGNEISFKFSHPPAAGNGADVNYSYRGKIKGDTIAGTFEMEWMDHTATREWEARRVKE